MQIYRPLWKATEMVDILLKCFRNSAYRGTEPEWCFREFHKKHYLFRKYSLGSLLDPHSASRPRTPEQSSCPAIETFCVYIWIKEHPRTEQSLSAFCLPHIPVNIQPQMFFCAVVRVIRDSFVSPLREWWSGIPFLSAHFSPDSSSFTCLNYL
jgi:hypothetical protein